MNNVERLATLNRIRKLSRLLDTSIRIPVIGFRFGLNPIIGLVPGLGDMISAGFSTYLLVMATRFRLPAKTIQWMVFNIAIESILGSVPLIGDLFDAYYKANIRNLALLEKHLQTAEPELGELDPMDLSSVSVAK
ncbi:DUF4112 domain-containing protein [Oculatella sp. LEGE 06141]|uniref:DUF4112 domain-containing protein n=1 Tax=Oculatella sp. LEGE 06141 TaxID=1828648 RepID=UPI0018803431|nr:DUF4112 domain-containing protein [Oculatella sp. LEGE 06141]MBE9177684.1 DUF4112 domain-containing protein [Oculatella sp. LEGE 06141]